MNIVLQNSFDLKRSVSDTVPLGSTQLQKKTFFEEHTAWTLIRISTLGFAEVVPWKFLRRVFWFPMITQTHELNINCTDIAVQALSDHLYPRALQLAFFSARGLKF